VKLLEKLRSKADKPGRDPVWSPALQALVAEMHYEIVPMKSIEQAIADLPPAAHVSVTCSPARGIGATQEYTERLRQLGHHAIPHLAARMVESADEVKQLAAWLREEAIDEVFVIAGDAPEPHGPYEGSQALVRDLLDADPGVSRIGYAGYPDGHALIEPSVIAEQLHAKHELIRSAGVASWISTQMCFDQSKIRAWLVAQRAAGITSPVRLGVPGVVDRTRLMTMGTRLGIGTSLRYLAKNRSTVMQLMAPGGYDPTDLAVAFADEASTLGIETLHSFTFNAVGDTRKWQEALLTRGSVSTVDA
jgi:methylenetetrahydrofolate reductase (NADPH)